jgi:hypothetical protein
MPTQLAPQTDGSAARDSRRREGTSGLRRETSGQTSGNVLHVERQPTRSKGRCGAEGRPEGQRDLNHTATRVGYGYHNWKAVAVDPGRLHHDAIHRLISVEFKRPRHGGAGEVEAERTRLKRE